MLLEESTTLHVHQTFNEVEKDVDSLAGTDQPTAFQHKAQGEPVPSLLDKEEPAAWKLDEGRKGKESDCIDAGPPCAEVDKTRTSGKELKMLRHIIYQPFAQVNKAIDSGTDPEQDIALRRDVETESEMTQKVHDVATEPAVYEHKAKISQFLYWPSRREGRWKRQGNSTRLSLRAMRK